MRAVDVNYFLKWCIDAAEIDYLCRLLNKRRICLPPEKMIWDFILFLIFFLDHPRIPEITYWKPWECNGYFSITLQIGMFDCFVVGAAGIVVLIHTGSQPAHHILRQNFKIALFRYGHVFNIDCNFINVFPNWRHFSAKFTDKNNVYIGRYNVQKNTLRISS